MGVKSEILIIDHTNPNESIYYDIDTNDLTFSCNSLGEEESTFTPYTIATGQIPFII